MIDRLVSVWLPLRPGERAGPCPAPSARSHPACWRLCPAPARLLEQHDVELDGDAATILGQRRDGKHTAAVLRDSAFHYLVVALPVTRPVLLGNNHVHGLAERLLGTPTEDRLRAGIP